MALFSPKQQPFRALYLAYQVPSTLFFWLPFWVLVSLPRALRPRPSWTLRQCVHIRLIDHLFGVSFAVGGLGKFPTYLALAPGIHIKGVWLDPVPHLLNPDSEIAAFARAASIQLDVRIPGYWLDKSGHNIEPGAPPTPGEKVVLALHGGAYVIGSAYPDDVTANIAKGLLEHTPGDGNIDGHANANSRADASANGSASSSSSPSVNGSSSSSSSSSSGSYLRRVFSVEYRLAIGPPGQPPAPFPAALIDALAGYDYLVNTVGFAPEDVVVDGDSAGGNLALALVRYLVEEKEFLSSVGSVDSVSSGSSTGTGADTSTTGTGARDKERKRKPLTPPGGLLLFSPWSDLGTSHEQPASQTPSYFRRTDYIGNMPEKDAKWAHGHFAGPMGVEALEANRWTSPASKHVQLKGATRKGEKHREGSSEGDEGTKGLFAGFPRTFLVCGGSEYLAPAIRTLKERLAVDLGEGGANGLSYHEAPDGVHDYCAMPWFDPARTETLKAVGRWIAEM